jgi:catechol 2,3-dioxygenase
MPATTVLGHVHLYVDDLDRAARFYHEGLGLDRVVWSYPGALFLSAGGYHHHLGTNTWAAGAQPAGENDARMLEWEIVLPAAADVSAAAESLERVGANVRRENVSATATDPWGTQLRLKAS